MRALATYQSVIRSEEGGLETGIQRVQAIANSIRGEIRPVVPDKLEFGVHETQKSSADTNLCLHTERQQLPPEGVEIVVKRLRGSRPRSPRRAWGRLKVAPVPLHPL